METYDSQFENYAIELITSLCSNNEKVTCVTSGIKLNGRTWFPDGVLPNGCSQLKLKENTYIEIKRSLNNYFLDILKYLVDNTTINIFLVLREKHNDFNIIHYKGREEERIKVVSIEELEITASQSISSTTSSNKVSDIDEDSTKKEDTTILNFSASGRKEKPTENKTFDTNSSASPHIPGNQPNSIGLAKEDFDNGNITLVVGAGVSTSAGLPTWDKLVANLLDNQKQKGLKIEDYPAISVASFNSPIIAARYLMRPFKSENQTIIENMKKALYPEPNKKFNDNLSYGSDLIDAIVDLCNIKIGEKYRKVNSIITFNYDDLIEQHLNLKNIDNQPVSTSGPINSSFGIPIYHVHGILQQNSINNDIPILSEDSYHNLYKEPYHWTNIEMLRAFSRTTCIFIGLSMSDPNLRRLLEFSHSESEGNTNHYAILPKRTLTNHNWDSGYAKKYYICPLEREAEFTHRQEETYRDLGVNVIWYEDGKYEQVPEILRKIAGLTSMSEETCKDSNDAVSESAGLQPTSDDSGCPLHHPS